MSNFCSHCHRPCLNQDGYSGCCNELVYADGDKGFCEYCLEELPMQEMAGRDICKRCDVPLG